MTAREQLITTVDRKAESGELRLALHGRLPTNVVESLVRSGLRGRPLQSRWIDTKAVGAALEKAGWPADEVEFALYRKLTTIFPEGINYP